MPQPFAEFLKSFADSMPAEYRRRHDAFAIGDHARIAHKRVGRVAVDCFRSTGREGAPVCIVADDAPGLLSRISAALVLSRLDVIDAQAYCRDAGDGRIEAVDLFWLRHVHPDAGRAVRLEEVARLRSLVVVLLDGTYSLPTLVAHVAEPPRGWAFGGTRLRFVIGDSAELVALDIETLDRPGLLFALTSALLAQRLAITCSEIRTLGHRVFDRFYFRELDGSAVLPTRRGEIEAELLSALQPPVGVQRGDPIQVEATAARSSLEVLQRS